MNAGCTVGHPLVLQEETSNFKTSPNSENLKLVKEKWLIAYKSWQHIEMFDYGKAEEIYYNPNWPYDPLFYANFTSKTNPETAPLNCENGFFLIPIATNLKDTEEIRDKYFNLIIEKLENFTKQDLRDSIIFKRSFCVSDFKNEYNSYGGNAYGLANTLFQTAFFRQIRTPIRIPEIFSTFA